MSWRICSYGSRRMGDTIIALDEPFVLAVDFQGSDSGVTSLIKLADNRWVHCGVHIDDMAALVVATGGEVLAIGWDRQEESIIKLVVIEKVYKIARKIVSDLCIVNRLCRVLLVYKHWAGSVGAFAQIPQLAGEIVTRKYVIRVTRYELSLTDHIEPLVEGIIAPGTLKWLHLELERSSLLKVRRLPKITDSKVPLRCCVQEHWTLLRKLATCDELVTFTALLTVEVHQVVDRMLAWVI